MLEFALLALLISLVVSATVFFLLSWTIRARLQLVEMMLHEGLSILTRQQKRAAADKSVEARQKPNPHAEELELAARIAANSGAAEEAEPWWAPIMRGGKRDGS
jgi:hypothetical protein